MANQLKTEVIVTGVDQSLANVDKFEKRIVDSEKRLADMGKRGGDAGRELAQGLGIPLGPTAALLAGIGLLTVGISKAMAAAREGADANRVLSASATEAGLAYDDAAGKAAKFAAQTGLSDTQAKQTFSSIIQVAKVAGQVDNLDEIQKRFADLAAARGVAAKDLATLSQQILSGQDEALNRLGLADPSKLAADWAKAHGTTVEAMTQTEQVASRLDAVMRKGAMFDGSAEDRLKSVSGQITLTEQAMGNLTTGVGEAIFANMEFRDLLYEVNNALKGITLSADTVRAKLKEGLTPKQIAEQLAGESSTWDGIKGAMTAPLAGLNVGYQQLFGNASDVESAMKAQEMALDPLKRRISMLTEQIEAEKLVMETQEKAAAQQAKDNITKLSAEKSATESKLANVDAAKKLVAEEAKQKENQTQILATFKETQTFLDDMAQRVNKDNPFVALFSQADTVMERMQKRFGSFGEEFVGMMAKVENQAIAMDQLAARIQSAQKVLDIQAEIRKLQFGQTGTSAEDQRRLGVFGKQIDAGRDIPALEAKARAAAGGRDPNALNFTEQKIVFDQQLASILSLKATGLTAYGSREAQSKINQELISLYESASPEMKKQMLGQNRGELAGAYTGQAADRTQAIKDDMRRADAARMAVENAMTSLADLKRFGTVENDEVRKVFLARTGALGEGELTPQLRQGREAALVTEAKKEAEKEKKAEEDRKLLNAALLLITKQITGKGFKTDIDGGVLLEIKDESSRAEVTGPSFGSVDDQQGMR